MWFATLIAVLSSASGSAPPPPPPYSGPTFFFVDVEPASPADLPEIDHVDAEPL